MKALVIGASGLVGGALLEALERDGAEATPAYRSRGHRGGRALDITDAGAVKDCLAAAKADWVFVAVNAHGGVDWCEQNPKETELVHVQGTRNILEAAGKSRIIFYSTDYVFDGKAGPYSEEDAPGPVSVYGRAKLEAERLLLERAPGALILRTTAVYGWDRTSKNFAMQVHESLQAGKSFKAPSDQWCNPTLAGALAETSVRLARLGAEGVFNVVGKDRMPRSELAKALAKAMALDPALIKPVPTSALGQKARRPMKGGLKTDKLKSVLGTEPLDLEESLKRFRRAWRADSHIAAGPVRPTGPAALLKARILKDVGRYWSLAHKPKPFVPYKTRIQYSGRVFGPQELVRLADSALDFWLTLGPCGEEFESRMRRFFGSKDFLFVSSGSTANLTAVMTLMSGQLEGALKPGDEVLTPAVTFPTTFAPLLHSGLVPVVVDCELGTYNVDPAKIEAALSPKTRALMVPHTLGNPCDMDVIEELARRRGLWLVEDACDALGSTFRGRLCGTFGALATLSFFPAHHMTTGEGGGVVVNEGRLGRIARSVRDWGRDCWCAPGESNTCGRRFGWQLGDLPRGYDHKYTYSNLGYNFKPTDLQAAIGCAQAERLETFVAARRANFKRLYKGLEKYADRLLLPRLDPRSEPSWFAFPITMQGGVSRGELVAWLENANIETRELFGGNILKQPGYKDAAVRVHGTLENSDRVLRDSFFIGVYPGLTEEMIAFMLKTFDAFFARGGGLR